MTVASAVRRGSTLVVATALTVLGWSANATGCPVCFAADESTRASFLWTAVALSALPLTLFAALGLWCWRELDQPAATTRASVIQDRQHDPRPAATGPSGR